MRQTSLGYGDVPDKYVCAECFDDYAIREFIKENAVEKICSYCSNKSDEPISAPLENIVDFICEGINTEWDNPVNCVGWESREGGWMGARVISSDELIRYEIEELENTNAQVLDDIVYSMIDREWCQRDPYGLRKEEALTLSWGDFADQVKHRTRYIFFRLNDKEGRFYDLDMIPVSKLLDRISHELSELEEEIDLIRVLDVGEKIFRARIHDENEELSDSLNEYPAVFSNTVQTDRIKLFIPS